MSPEQFLLLVLAFSSSTLSLLFSLLLLLPSRRSRDRRDPFLDCRDHCSAKGPATPKPQFPPGRVTDVHGETIGYRSISSPRKP